MKILLSRVYEKQQKEKEEKLASKRKLLVGSGDRSEKITLYKLEEVLSGNALNEVIEALKEADQEEKVKNLI